MAPRPKVVPLNAPMPQQDWVWDGANWTCDGHPEPPGCDPDCPPAGWPQPCPPFFPPPSNQAPWYPGANGGVSFSQTAPQCPIRGHFWYDGKILWMFDGAAWVDVGLKGISTLVGGGGSTAPVFIGATAPPAAAPGTLWWNGTELQLWDGTKWNFIGPTATPTVPTVTSILGVSYFNASQTITIPASATRAFIQMWGATGGSGGVSNGASGGTGAGGYLEKFLTDLTPGNTMTFVCGTGGTAGTSGGVGHDGGPGTVTTLTSGTQSIPGLTCNPSQGSAGATGPSPTVGTVGGTATGGDLNAQGQTGVAGIQSENFLGSSGGETFFSRGADGQANNGSAPGFPGTSGGIKITWYP